MTTDVRHTGPRTEAGKTRSLLNSTKHGLFARRDFILEGEDEEYAQTFTDLMTELSPADILEQTFATEIMGANWRLRRCGILEFDLARSSEPAADAQTGIQKSVDRARAQSHNILRRSLAELRKLQTERHTRTLNFPRGEVPADLGVTDTRQAVRSAAQSILAASSFCKPAQAAPATAENAGSSFCKPAQAAPATAENGAGSSFCKPAQAAPATAENGAGSSFCKPAAAIPRNALCPCRSGAKYKRCCGKNAPPVLNKGASI